MRFILLFLLLIFCNRAFARTFTLTGSSVQESTVIGIVKQRSPGYAVFCNFTTMPNSVDIQIHLGTDKTLQTQASNLLVTTATVHGLEVDTHANFAKVVLAPTGGSFTAVCTDNQR